MQAVGLKAMLHRFEHTNGHLRGISTDNASWNYLMSRKLQSILQDATIELPGWRNHLPCLVHFIQLALGGFMSSVSLKGLSKSWEAHERNQQFGENKGIDMGNSQRLRKEGNARINKVSPLRPCLAMIIEKVCISRYLQSAETNLHIAENACCIHYADTWSSKWDHWQLQSQCLDCATTYYLCEDILGFDNGVDSASLSIPRIHPVSGSRIKDIEITGHISQHRMNGPLSSTSWKFWAHSDTGPCGCGRRIWSHCFRISHSMMKFSIIWIALRGL